MHFITCVYLCLCVSMNTDPLLQFWEICEIPSCFKISDVCDTFIFKVQCYSRVMFCFCWMCVHLLATQSLPLVVAGGSICRSSVLGHHTSLKPLPCKHSNGSRGGLMIYFPLRRLELLVSHLLLVIFKKKLWKTPSSINRNSNIHVSQSTGVYMPCSDNDRIIHTWNHGVKE